MAPKYIQVEIDRLKGLKNGMTVNAPTWTGLPVIAADVQAAIDALEQKAAAIEEFQDTLGQLQRQAHIEVATQGKIGDHVEKLAIGLHSAEPEKLVHYDIRLKKAPTPLPAPGMAIISAIADDVDGEGFIINIQALSYATDFEIYKGSTVSPDLLSLDPAALGFLAITKKLSYTDNNVVKGKRYFYMVRGFNRKGRGQWSAVASRVQ